ncbi:substrate-binding periplasmic protein [Pseudoalteromonas sp. SSDWG2]|uniref:substrate-binding periplasmic protein n=1 Tax=Pseudoalteromonas sp. SSDWG2 TaxID=3139391 RepID=UPI003BA8D952
MFLLQRYFAFVIFTSLLSVFCTHAKDTLSPTNEFHLQYQVGSVQRNYTGEWRVQSLFIDAGKPSTVIVATLNWPPYIGRQQCKNGWLTHYMAAVLIESGYNPEFRFLPWVRAVRMVELGHADILAPEYEIEPSSPSDVVAGDTRLQHLAMSVPFANTPVNYLALAKSNIKEAPSLTELPNYSLGVVRGYQNSPDVDALIDSGKLVTALAVDDAQNLSLLLRARVNLIIGDPTVIDTLANRAGIDTRAYRVLQPAITEQSLYFALSKSKPRWQTLLQHINTTIEQFKAANMDVEFALQIGNECSQQ